MTPDEVYRVLRNWQEWRPLSGISVTELAVQFEVSPDEVLAALYALEADGRIATVSTVRVVEVSP